MLQLDGQEIRPEHKYNNLISEAIGQDDVMKTLLKHGEPSNQHLIIALRNAIISSNYEAVSMLVKTGCISSSCISDAILIQDVGRKRAELIRSSVCGNLGRQKTAAKY